MVWAVYVHRTDVILKYPSGMEDGARKGGGGVWQHNFMRGNLSWSYTINISNNIYANTLKVRSANQAPQLFSFSLLIFNNPSMGLVMLKYESRGGRGVNFMNDN